MDKFKTADDYILKASGTTTGKILQDEDAPTKEQAIINLQNRVYSLQEDLISTIKKLKDKYGADATTGKEEEVAAAMGITKSTSTTSTKTESQKGYLDLEKPQIAMLVAVAALQLLGLIIVCSKLK